MSTQATKRAVLSQYRRALKLSLDWTVYRYIWRGQALYIRSVFEANKHVTEPRKIQALIAETEGFLYRYAHPEPYKFPSAAGGTKWERNLEMPILDPPPRMNL